MSCWPQSAKSWMIDPAWLTAPATKPNTVIHGKQAYGIPTFSRAFLRPEKNPTEVGTLNTCQLKATLSRMAPISSLN